MALRRVEGAELLQLLRPRLFVWLSLIDFLNSKRHPLSRANACRKATRAIQTPSTENAHIVAPGSSSCEDEMSLRTWRRAVGFKAYLVISALAFIAATLIVDIVAGMTFDTTSFSSNVFEYVKGPNAVFVLLSISPFIAVALISGLLNRSSGPTRSLPLFSTAILALVFSYAKGHWNSQLLLQKERWTAASFSVGVLPFIGFGIVFVTICVAALASQLGRRRSGE